jgi:hypothetical protein
LTKIGNHRLIGKWRITDMELWDAEFIDMLEPAYVQFDADGGGQFVFGAVQGQLDCRDNGASLRFTWVGNDEGTKPPETVRPSFRPTAPSKAPFGSTSATSPPSAPDDGRFSAAC